MFARMPCGQLRGLPGGVRSGANPRPWRWRRFQLRKADACNLRSRTWSQRSSTSSKSEPRALAAGANGPESEKIRSAPPWSHRSPQRPSWSTPRRGR
ncbi:unnamed protein product [Symbiodinium sp. CCMP2592]|nr:unnamed protein product [Symbiodinium sp. CCMP2592]